MKIMIFDYNEFEESDSEQFLAFASSHTKHFDCIESFYDATVAYREFKSTCSFDMSNSMVIGKVQYSIKLASNLLEFCQVSLVGSEQVFVLNESWDEQDYVFAYEHRYIRCFWCASV